MPGPLDGITIVDLTRYQNGPHATVMLSDMGAEIIKVEMPGNGDPGRSLGIAEDGFCSYFESLNRGKKSITLNLYQPGAREIMHKLIEKARRPNRELPSRLPGQAGLRLGRPQGGQPQADLRHQQRLRTAGRMELARLL